MKIPRPYKVVRDKTTVVWIVVHTKNSRDAMFGHYWYGRRRAAHAAKRLNAAFAAGWKERGKRGSR